MRFNSIARQILLTVLPGSLELPVRYGYSCLMGQIEPELRIVAARIVAGDIVVDVGANVGLYAFALARRGARVHAFEPVRACRKVLESYAHPQIQVHAEALSDHSGRMVMRIPVWHGNSETALATLVEPTQASESAGDVDEAVEVRTLDSYGFEKVQLLKIDVEGHELRVIRGARALIARTRPVMLIEIEQRRLSETNVREVLGEVESLGYEGYFFTRGTLRPVREFDVHEHQLQWVGEIERNGFSQNYINNFLFVPAGNSRWLAS
jgi:FkbM family methyltransferase